MREAATPRISRRTALACSTFVTAQKLPRENNGSRRLTVSRNIVSRPAIFSNCLGVRIRLRGQKRVPRPPASRTAQEGSVDFFIDAPIATTLIRTLHGLANAAQIPEGHWARRYAATQCARSAASDRFRALQVSSTPAQVRIPRKNRPTQSLPHLQELSSDQNARARLPRRCVPQIPTSRSRSSGTRRERFPSPGRDRCSQARFFRPSVLPN